MLKNDKIVQYTLPVKSLDRPSHLMFFLYFCDYLHSRFSLEALKLQMNTWNYVVNKKVRKNFKKQHFFYFRFFKIATLCFDYCFAHSWLSLDELHEVVT